MKPTRFSKAAAASAGLLLALALLFTLPAAALAGAPQEEQESNLTTSVPTSSEAGEETEVSSAVSDASLPSSELEEEDEDEETTTSLVEEDASGKEIAVPEPKLQKAAQANGVFFMDGLLDATPPGAVTVTDFNDLEAKIAAIPSGGEGVFVIDGYFPMNSAIVVDDITVTIYGENNAVLESASARRHFIKTSNRSTINLHDMTIQAPFAGGGGIASYLDPGSQGLPCGTVGLYNCEVKNIFGDGSWTSIFNAARFNAEDTNFSDCGIYALSNGFIYADYVTMNNCHFTNIAHTAVHLTDNSTITNSTFTNVYSLSSDHSDGFAVQATGNSGTLSMNNVTFTNNVVGVYSSSKRLSLTNCLFEDNGQDNFGNAVYLYGTPFSPGHKFNNCTFKDNSSDSGSAIFIYPNGAMQVTLDDCDFENNISKDDASNTSYRGNGGAINIASFSSSRYVNLTINGGKFVGNKSQNGAGGAIGFMNLDDGNVATLLSRIKVNGTTFSGNTSDTPDVDIFEDAQLLDLHGANITGVTGTSVGPLFLYNNRDIAATQRRSIAYLFYQSYEHVTLGASPRGVAYAVAPGNFTVRGPSNYDVETMGHTFDYWKTENLASGFTVAAGTSLPQAQYDPVTGLIVKLWPKWVDTYDLTWNYNTGNPADNVTVPHTEYELITKPQDPEREGYEFLQNWYVVDETALTEEDYWAYAWQFDTDAMPSEDLTLTARWSVKEYVLTWDLGLGGVPESSLAAYNTPLVAPALPANPGYTFAGWYEGGTKWNLGGAKMPARDLSLTAQWTKNPVESSSSDGGATTTPTTSKGGNGGGDNSTPTTTPPSTSRVVPTSQSSASAATAPSTAPSAIVAVSQSSSAVSSTPPDSTSTVTPVVELDPNGNDYIQDNGSVNLFGSDIPLGGLSSRGGWGLMNLIMALLACATTVFVTVQGVLKGTLTRPMRLVSIATGILPLLFFLILENKAQMIIFSRWTPLLAVLFIAHIALFVVTLVQEKQAKNKQYTEEDA